MIQIKRYLREPAQQVAGAVGGIFTSRETGESAQLANRTFRILAISFALDGAAYGLFFYAAFTLAKVFNASPMMIALAGMCLPVGLLLAYPIGYFFAGKPKGTLFIVAAALSLASAIGFAIFPSSSPLTIGLGSLGAITLPAGWSFLLWMAIFGLAEAIKFPARYSTFQTNFSYRERSRMLGALYIFYSLIEVGVMFWAGNLLDTQFGLYRVIFPAAMVLAVISSLLFLLVPSIPLPGAASSRFAVTTVFKPYWHIIKMIRTEKYFMGFELGYFLYGMGFMTVSAVLPMIYSDKLGAKYGQFGLTGVIAAVVMLSSPFIGKWSDRIAPTKLAIVAFGMNALFPIMLIFCLTPMHGYLAHIWFSAAWTLDIMAWNVGPIFFSGSRDASKYVGINATLTGVRALIAFTMAGLVQQGMASFTPVLIIASAFFVAGCIVMVIVHRVARNRKRFDTTVSGRYFYVEK